jgi:hypothetical protein
MSISYKKRDYVVLFFAIALCVFELFRKARTDDFGAFFLIAVPPFNLLLPIVVLMQVIAIRFHYSYTKIYKNENLELWRYGQLISITLWYVTMVAHEMDNLYRQIFGLFYTLDRNISRISDDIAGISFLCTLFFSTILAVKLIQVKQINTLTRK